MEPSRAAPGETFRLHGGDFYEGCYDAGPPFLEWLEEPGRQDIRVELRQGERTWTLASGLAASDPPDYALDVRLEVPAGAEPGKAVVVIPDPSSAGPMKMPFQVILGGEG